jgi:thermitase
MPVRTADGSGYAIDSDVGSGVTWAANHGARVANIGFNANGSSTVSSAAKYFQSKNGVVTVAAGNGGACVQPRTIHICSLLSQRLLADCL